MKRLLAIVLAVIMVLPFCVVTSAEDSATVCTVYTGDSTKYYNPDRRITITLSLRDINFGANDGVSAIDFDLYYDKNRLTPVTQAAEDSEGDMCSFTKLISSSPKNWEGIGKLYEDEGRYALSFTDMSGKGVVNQDDQLVIKIPFQTDEAARVSNMVFDFRNFVVYNKNMKVKYEIDVPDVVITYAVQPAVNAKLPAECIPIHVAGYRHDTKNFIYYAKSLTNINSFVRKYCDATYDQHMLKTFAIAIVNIDGIITSVNLKTGDKADKALTAIPAGSYVIGVSSGNKADFQKFTSWAKVGKQVTVYNVNIEGAGNRDTAVDLNNAAFVIDDPSDDPPFIGGYDPNLPVTPADPDLDGGDEVGDYMLGDVNESGEIDSMDYVLVKRAYFGTFDFNEKQFKSGDVNKSGDIDSMDYVLVKRAYFGTFTIA